MKKILGILLLCLSLATPSYASYIPYGILNDISFSTVINDWGWEVNFAAGYGADYINIDQLFHDISPDSYVMLASLNKSTQTFDVLAAALLSDVTYYTTQNELHFANGVNWYYNGGSMGFAGESDTINQYEADINGLDERDRLSWHTSANGLWDSYGTVPTELRFGWRSGSNLGLSDDTFIRYILVGQAPEPTTTPEPSTLALAALGLAGVFCLHRRLKK